MNKFICLLLCLLVHGFTHAVSRSQDEDTTPSQPSTSVCSSASNPNSNSSSAPDDRCGAWGLEWRLVQGAFTFETGTENVVYAFNSLDDVRRCLKGELADGHKMKTVCDDGGPWRLPNIKELANMFRYTADSTLGNSALNDAMPRDWFHHNQANRRFIAYELSASGDGSIESNSEYWLSHLTSDGASNLNISESVTPYVLSATLRDSNNNDDGDVQILAINLKTGAIEAFTRTFQFCPLVSKTATCTHVKTVRNPAVNPMFVFRVKTLSSPGNSGG